VLWQTRLGEPLRRQFEAAGWGADDTAAFYQRLEPYNLSLFTPPERREIFAAESDHFIPLQYTQQMQRRWQQPYLHVYRSGHIGLLWSRKFLRDVRRTVAQQLRLGRRSETPVTVVTEEAIQSLPINLSLPTSAPEPAPQFAAQK
jgi:hypothetical protein